MSPRHSEIPLPDGQTVTGGQHHAPFPPWEHAPATSLSSSSYSLATLFLVMTLLAVWLAVLSAMPALGVMLAMVGVPALVRTMQIVGERRERGSRTSAGEKISLFFWSAAIVVTIALAGILVFVQILALAFFLSLLAGGLTGSAEVCITVAALGVLVGIIVALYISIKFAWSLWKDR